VKLILQNHDNWRGQMWQHEFMKTKLCLLVFILAAMLSHAQTNNLTSLLQQGLLEEQANRNLDAAISNYQSLASQFDKDRQLAATAIFRLGECYRMQGKTNEAALEYQRILRDFADQQTLATLSRQDLVGMGAVIQPSPQAESQTTVTKAPPNLITSNFDENQEIQRIQTMIQNSPDLINAPDGSRHTPLENSAINGQLKVAAFLLDHGADVNARGGSALFAATGSGNRTMVEFLLAHGADVNAINNSAKRTPLEDAVQYGFEAVTEVLLANKAEVNAQDSQGSTPLFIAAQLGKTNIVQMLLTAGADVNLENNEGRTPLSVAVENGSLEAVKLLLAAKADPNGGTNDAPLMCAIYKHDITSAGLLLQAGANPNLKGNALDLKHNGYNEATPLWMAVSMNQLPMVQLLLKFKADPNDSQIDNKPVIFSAVSNTNILEALLNAGAEVDARDSTTKTGDNRILNWTPLLLSVETGLPVTTVEILLKHGANPNARDGAFGSTPLHWMAGWGFQQMPNRKVLELLLDYKADPNVRNDAGQTPLYELKQWAAGNNLLPEQKTYLVQLADLLRQHGALDVLPDWDRITVSRPSVHYSAAMFYQGTNNWNHFTLFDLLGVQYDLLTASPTGAKRVRAVPYCYPANDNSFFPGGSSYSVDNNRLSFPDFTRIVIHRPSATGTNWNELKINLARALNSGDCSGDVPLRYGDVVEIHEADHVINEKWPGLSTNELFTLKSCLTRHLQITVNGQTTNIIVAPQVWELIPGSSQYPLSSFGAKMPPAVGLLTAEPFMLWPVLENSKLLLASSDLSRVVVRRRDTATGKMHEWTVDCSDPGQPPNFWLHDGDVIEVPEKP